MSLTAVLTYARGILSWVQWEHWAVMGVVSLVLMVILLIRKKCSVYGALALCLTDGFHGPVLLDTAVVIRFLGIMPYASGNNLILDFSRICQKNGQGPVETISNIAVFGGVLGINEADRRLAPDWLGCVGRLRIVTLHRVSPVGFEGGDFRGDGFVGEYGGGFFWGGSECGGEENFEN